MKTLITADDLEYDLTVVEPRITTLPLAEEITSAVQTLRAHGYVRAANRLERASQNLLNPKVKKNAPQRIAIRKIRTASGEILKLSRAISIDAERLEQMK